jgi:hypothetical protein
MKTAIFHKMLIGLKVKKTDRARAKIFCMKHLLLSVWIKLAPSGGLYTDERFQGYHGPLVTKKCCSVFKLNFMSTFKLEISFTCSLTCLNVSFSCKFIHVCNISGAMTSKFYIYIWRNNFSNWNLHSHNLP